MTNRNKLIMVVAVILLGTGIALWVTQTPSVPVPKADAPSKPPAAAPIMPQAQANAAATPRRGFVTLGIMERNAIIVEIGKKDLSVIFQTMLDAGRVEHDVTKQLTLQTLLCSTLVERTPDRDLLDRMKEFIGDEKNSHFERGLVLAVLGNPQTKETVDALLDIIPTLTDKELKQIAFDGIGHLGTGGKIHEDLSPALERVWRKSDDQVQLAYVAKALAQVGASSGVSLLLDEALAEKDTVHRPSHRVRPWGLGLTMGPEVFACAVWPGRCASEDGVYHVLNRGNYRAGQAIGSGLGVWG